MGILLLFSMNSCIIVQIFLMAVLPKIFLIVPRVFREGQDWQKIWLSWLGNLRARSHSLTTKTGDFSLFQTPFMVLIGHFFACPNPKFYWPRHSKYIHMDRRRMSKAKKSPKSIFYRSNLPFC